MRGPASATPAIAGTAMAVANVRKIRAIVIQQSNGRVAMIEAGRAGDSRLCPSCRNRNLWLCRRSCLMRFPRRLRSPIPRPNSVAFCPLGIDYCSQCKHGVGTAQSGAAEVRRLHPLAAIDDKTACNQAVRRSRSGIEPAYSAWEAAPAHLASFASLRMRFP